MAIFNSLLGRTTYVHAAVTRDILVAFRRCDVEAAAAQGFSEVPQLGALNTEVCGWSDCGELFRPQILEGDEHAMDAMHGSLGPWTGLVYLILARESDMRGVRAAVRGNYVCTDAHTEPTIKHGSQRK